MRFHKVQSLTHRGQYLKYYNENESYQMEKNNDSLDITQLYNHMNLISLFRSVFHDWVFLAGFSSSLLGFLPTLFLAMEPFAVAIQIVTGTGGIMILGITIFTKIIEAQRTYLKYLREKKNLDKNTEG